MPQHKAVGGADFLTFTFCSAEGYIPPKQAYSFEAMLHDILDFAFAMLVDNGRLCMWMPTANDEEVTLAIPSHPGLELAFVSVQDFSKCKSKGVYWLDRLGPAPEPLPSVDIELTTMDVSRVETSTHLSTPRKRRGG